MAAQNPEAGALTAVPATTLTPERQADILKALGLNPSDPKTTALLMVCQRYNLDPLLKHCIIIGGQGMYVTRDGLMHVAHSSGRFNGMEVLSLAETSTHYVAKATVWRKDMERGFTFQGRFPKAKPMAKEHGPEMAEKVAVCRALRHAFDVALCSREETWEQDDYDIAPVAPSRPVEDRLPPPTRDRQPGEVFRRANPREPQNIAAGPAPALPRETEEAMGEFGMAAEAAGLKVRKDGALAVSPKMLRELAFEIIGAEELVDATHQAWKTPVPWVDAKALLVGRLADGWAVTDGKMEPPAPEISEEQKAKLRETLGVPDPNDLEGDDFEDPFAPEEKPAPKGGKGGLL